MLFDAIYYDTYRKFNSTCRTTSTSASSGTTRSPPPTAWANKIVFKFHLYTWSHSESFLPTRFGDSSCSSLQTDLGHASGFILRQGEKYTAPLWLSEFGLNVGAPSVTDRRWLACVVDYMTGNDAEWDLWTLGGDYYVRSGQFNYEESFGLFDTSWGDWRNKEFPAMLGGMWDMTQGP